MSEIKWLHIVEESCPHCQVRLSYFESECVIARGIACQLCGYTREFAVKSQTKCAHEVNDGD